jgi:dTDP-4-dehydrorhamnose reductase
MKIFLTGESGILGSDIANLLKKQGHEYIGFNSSNINISDFEDVKSKMHAYKPDVVIHCAAMTNVDLCEDDKDAAIAINVTGSQNLAQAANDINAKIVYISSCGVYGNGKTSPYTEQDQTAPLTYHHYTKLEGEKRVTEFNKRFLVVRPGWLFGGTLQHKKNFVEARRKEAMNTSVLKSAVDKVGSPTYTADLAQQILRLLELDLTGVFNIVNEGCASRYDYVTEIVKLFNYPTIVEGVNSNSFPRKANMPDNECLENAELNLKNANQMRHWKDALKSYITTTYTI